MTVLEAVDKWVRVWYIGLHRGPRLERSRMDPRVPQGFTVPQGPIEALLVRHVQ